jgi:triacylglycerol lipase
VLLVHGTGATGPLNWGWNYAKVLPTLGYDVCMVNLPDRALDDIQVASEYVVYAVRNIAQRSGHKVDVMGHSQGGLEPRWALKWWPDTQQLVDDWVMLASPNHGTVVADYPPSGLCTEACYQMSTHSKFIAALNAGDETPGDVSYTSLYSQTDELVQPVTTAPLDGASNVMIQDLCPGRPLEHAAMAADAVTYALVIDAFTHLGPADPARINRNVCSQGTFPGVDVLSGFGIFLNEVLSARSNPYHPVAGEPPLKPYVTAP